MSRIYIARWAAALSVAALLGGCSVGVGSSGTLSGSFDAPVGYRKGYENAIEQARTCLVGEGAYQVDGALDDAGRRGRVRVVPKLLDGSPMATVDVSGLDEGHSRVSVEMWGSSLWDAAAMRAMRDAVVFGVPSCTAYMPARRDASYDAWFSRRQ
jgi:hypothetical protein